MGSCHLVQQGNAWPCAGTDSPGPGCGQSRAHRGPLNHALPMLIESQNIPSWEELVTIIESLELGGTFKSPLFQLSCTEQGHAQLGQAAQGLI